MSEFNKGDIIVSLKDQKSSDRNEPVLIFEGYIGENISPEDVTRVFFKDTPPARGSYKAENFRLATTDEKNQYMKGRKIVEPPCPFEEDDIVITTKIVESIDSSTPNTLPEGLVMEVDGIIKSKEPGKSVIYFRSDNVSIDGYYKIDDSFRLANDEERNLFYIND